MGMSGLLTQNVFDIPVPCKSCTYTYVKTDMVYKNGTSANTNTGAYMHHITLFSLPPDGFTLKGVTEALGAVYSQMTGGPMDPDKMTAGMKPFYLIGNERLPLTFPKAGVYLNKNPKIFLSVRTNHLGSSTQVQ